MRLQQLKRLILLPASAMVVVALGCHCCLKSPQTTNCQAPGPECATSPNGTVFEEEKAPKKLRKNARKDSKINADGCTPEDERIPLLKRIADKSNQESDIPLIKAAAKIKHEEEMCQQKIKAVKYLATKGCCCYDEDGEVSQAMLEALNDCLPAVRMAAVQAIGGCVCGKAYPRTCCTPKIAARLDEMAYQYDKNGCPKEPNQQIREWAAYVAQYCPKQFDPKVKENIESPTPIEGGKKPDSNEENGTTNGPDIPPGPLPVQTFNQNGTVVIEEERVAVAADVDEAELEVVANVRQPANYFLRSQNSDVCPLAANVATADSELNVVDSGSVFRARSTSTGSEEYHSIHTAAAIPPSSTPRNSTFSDASVATIARVPKATARPQATAEQIGLVSANDEQDPFETNVIPIGTESTRGVASFRSTEPVAAAPVAKVEVVEPSAFENKAVLNASQPVRTIPSNVIPAAIPDVAVPVSRNANQGMRFESIQGRIESVDLQNETAAIRLFERISPGPTCRVHVVHKYALGRIQAIGEFEVLSSEPGAVIIRPVAGTSMRKISVGDAATIYGN